MSRAVPACPHCAAGDELPLVCDRCGWRWHANPLPAAGVLVERDAGPDGDPSVLLLKRAVEPGIGWWDLPAGYLDPGESFEDAARRETREEAGLDVQLLAVSGVYHSPAGNAVTVVYRARPRGDEDVRVDHESTEHAWVPRSDVPGWIDRMAFPSMAAALADWAAGRVGGPSADGA